MQQFIEQLGLSGLRVPGYVIALLMLLNAVIKSKPITFFSSNQFERLFFSKEQKLLFKIFRYIQISFIFSLIILISSPLVINLEYDKNFGVIFFLLTIFIYFLLSNEQIIKWFLEKFHLKKKSMDSFIAIYLVFLIFSIIYIFGISTINTIQLNYPQLNKNEIFWSNFFAFFIFYYFWGLIVSLIAKKLYFVNSLMPEGKVYFMRFTADKSEQEMWYFLQTIGKGEILLGNKPAFDRCTKLKIIERSKILLSEIEVEDNK